MKKVLVGLILIINYNFYGQYRNKLDVIHSRNGLMSDHLCAVKEGLHHNIWIATDTMVLHVLMVQF